MATPRGRTPGTPRTPAGSQTVETTPLATPALDILPSLHAILSTLLPDTPGLPGQTSQPDGAAAPTADDAPSAGDKHLEIQQLGPEASAIKIKIQKARAALKNLPDADRSVEEQEEDIRLLEERITKMRAMLSGLGVRHDADVEMG